MTFNPIGKYIKEEFTINRSILEPVKSFCYLGFEVKPSGTVKHAMNTLYDKANKALRPLLCAIARFNLPVKTSIKLFHTLISPIVLYNVEIWATMTDKSLRTFTENDIFNNVDKCKTDVIHRKLLKYVLGLSKSCPNMTVYGDTGEIPLSIKGYRLMIDYWNRLTTLPDSNLAKKALLENVKIRSNWIMTLEKLLKTFNLTEVSSDQFKLLTKGKTISYYTSLWKTKIKNEDLARLNFYKKLNNDFIPAKYTDLPSFNMRKTIAKLRCSNHCLEIETGRHRNILRENRCCNICTGKNIIEDEEHFLSKCKLYGNLKTRYEIISHNAVDIMNIRDQRNLAQYLICAFNLRKEILNEKG